MVILGIETSCDETAVSLIKGSGDLDQPRFEVLAHIVSSQIETHAKWGGVVPSLAKREHSRNLIPVLKEALEKARLIKIENFEIKPWKLSVEKILEREPELLTHFLDFVPKMAVPAIDAIAVTQGPGLEPALWVGINLARALALVWQKPLIPINHLEGHIYSVLVENEGDIRFPALALLVSGGHTELILLHDWFEYELLGATRDDAVGEAFDKTARLLDLPYPGGPALSQLAASSKEMIPPQGKKLPRPMIHSNDLDFSFSGLKTAVLYLINDLKEKDQFDDKAKIIIAKDFEEAVIDVLLAKTLKAVKQYGPQTLIIAGGVSANKPLRERAERELEEKHPEVSLLLPASQFSLDNATMIAVAGYLKREKFGNQSIEKIVAQGNLSLP